MIGNYNLSTFSINTVHVYKNGQLYVVTVEENGIVAKLAEFNQDHFCKRTEGITPIKDESFTVFLNQNFDVLTEKLGQPHTDVGSGFLIPSYITETAKLVSFTLEDTLITSVTVRDLFSGDILISLNS